MTISNKTLFPLLCAILLVGLPVCTHAQGTSVTGDLTVTTIERNPFVRSDGDKLEGFSIELWRAIADDNDWTYNFTVVDSFIELLRPVRNSETDLAIANISITADREEVMDFSNSIFRSGLQIMIPRHNDNLRLRNSLRDPVLLTIIAGLIAAAFVSAHMLWWREHKSSEKIARKYARGISDALWWTLTLGGFGRNLPQSVLGRLALLGWMGALTAGLTLFTAQLASSFTTQTIGERISTYKDLQGKKIGTTAGSTSESFLRTRGMKSIPYNNIEELFRDVSTGKLDAVIHDAPLLQYYGANDGKDTVVIAGELFNAEDYGIALPPGSPLRENINASLLRLRENGTYDTLYSKWFERK